MKNNNKHYIHTNIYIYIYIYIQKYNLKLHEIGSIISGAELVSHQDLGTTLVYIKIIIKFHLTKEFSLGKAVIQ